MSRQQRHKMMHTVAVTPQPPQRAHVPASVQPVQEHNEPPTIPFWRCCSAEVVGTFFLTLAAAGGRVIGAATGQPVGHAADVVAPGLVVMVLIYTLGAISGAHFNPAVTFAFAVRRDFPWSHVPGFWLAQLGGALLAAALLRALFGTVGHLGMTEPAAQLGVMPALAMEIILTLLLILVVLGTAKEHRLTGHNAALAVGATIALAGLFASPVSGASMNPARSLGPAIVALHLTNTWIYVIGPFIGAAIAVGLTWLLHGQPNRDEAKTGSGQANQHAQTQSRSA